MTTLFRKLVDRRRARGWPESRLHEPPRSWVRGGPYARGRRPAPPPIPDLDAHPLVTEAVAALRPYERHELGSDMDSIARDLVGVWCLARVEGSDPAFSIAAARGRYAQDRQTLVHGLDTMTDLVR